MSITPTQLAIADATVLDRTVARFYDPEATVGATGARFLHLRELVVDGWLSAGERGEDATFDERALRLAMDRSIVDVLLGSRTLSPLAETKLARAQELSTIALEDLLGGKERVGVALDRACGKRTRCEDDFRALMKRRARAEVYLESAVTQPVEPTEEEILAEYRREGSKLALGVKLRTRYFARVRARKLREVSQAYLGAVRARLRLEILSR